MYYTYSIFFRLSLDFVSSIGEVAMASSDYPVPASMMRTSCACSARRRSANISGVGKEPLGHVETLSSHISSLDGEKPSWGRAFFRHRSPSIKPWWRGDGDYGGWNSHIDIIALPILGTLQKYYFLLLVNVDIPTHTKRLKTIEISM